MFVTASTPRPAWSNLVAHASIVGTAAVVALAPAATPHLTPAGAPAARLSAAVSPFDADVAAALLDPAALLVPSTAAASAISDAIENLYLDVEQWVRYGVNLIAWAAGWVPFAGLLAPQINFFYDLGEAMVRSAVFNTVDWLTGDIGFGQALSDFGSDVTDAFNDFFNDQINWIRHFAPPMPPISPFDAGATLPDSSAAADAVAVLEPDPGLDPDVLVDAPDGDGLLSLLP